MPPKRKGAKPSATSVAEAVEAQRKKLADAGKKAASSILSAPVNDSQLQSASESESDPELEPEPTPLRLPVCAPAVTPVAPDLDDDLTEQLLSKYAPEQMYMPGRSTGTARRRGATPTRGRRAELPEPEHETHSSDGPFSVSGSSQNQPAPGGRARKIRGGLTSNKPSPSSSSAAGLDSDENLSTEPGSAATRESSSADSKRTRPAPTFAEQLDAFLVASPTSNSSLVTAYAGGLVGGVLVIAICIASLFQRLGGFSGGEDGDGDGVAGVLQGLPSSETVRVNLGQIISYLGLGVVILMGLYMGYRWLRARQRREQLLSELLAQLKRAIRERDPGSLSAGGYPSRFYMEEVTDLLQGQGQGQAGESAFAPAVARLEVVALWPEVEERICEEDTRIRRFRLTVGGETDWMFQWLRGDDYVAFGRAETGGGAPGGTSEDGEPAPIFAKTGLSYS